MIGCVLYELATLRKPFEAPSIPDLVEKIKNQNFIPISKNYSNELQFLIEKLLNKDPQNRPSIKEVLNFGIGIPDRRAGRVRRLLPGGNGIFRADRQTCAAGVQPEAADAHPVELRGKRLAFRAVAPGTAQRAALEKNGGADAGPVLYGEALNIV